MFTIEDAKSHVEKYADEIKDSYDKCDAFPKFMRGLRMWEVWKAGCFLNWHLQELECEEEERRGICFAHGQRSVFGDPWEWAVKYLNDYIEGGVKDKPGPELADEINNEVFK